MFITVFPFDEQRILHNAVCFVLNPIVNHNYCECFFCPSLPPSYSLSIPSSVSSDSCFSAANSIPPICSRDLFVQPLRRNSRN